MTSEMIILRALLEKSFDADLLREMIGFTAHRLMELEVAGLTGAGHGERSPDRLTWRIRLPRARLGDPRRHRRAAHPQAAPGELFPGFPAAVPDGREGVERGRPPGSWTKPAPSIIASSARLKSRPAAIFPLCVS